MIDRSYLLKYLQPRDRILLYGKGRNVTLNYQYLVDQPQFQIVGIITPDADQIIDPAIPMYYPHQLKLIPASDYDKVIITVRDQKMGVEMYRAILKSGVDKEKIVAAHIYLGPTTGMPLESFIEDPASVQAEIKKFIDEKYGSIFYFDPLIEKLKEKKDEQNILRKQLKKTSYLLSPLENIVFLYIISLTSIFDAELMESLMRSTLRLDQPDLLYFLHGIYHDTNSITFSHEEYLFPEYYVLRRALTKKLCKMYDFHIKTNNIRKDMDGKIRKILIVVGSLRNHKHAPTLVVMQFSGMLAELGYEVQVIPLDINSNIAWEFPVFRPVHSLAYYGSREFEEYQKTAKHRNVDIEYTDLIDPKEKMQQELNKIIMFSPDLIIDMGTETSIISYVYSKYFLTLCIPLNSCQASTYFTYFGVIDHEMFVTANEIYHSVDNKQILQLPSPIIPKAKAKTKYERGSYPLALLDRDDFVLISVGNRIGAELTEDFINIVCEKLLAKQNIKWLIVGGKSNYIAQRYEELLAAQKIVFIPYEDDLPALYQICDVYISPKRRGGGTSVFWAMHYGLPIAQAFSSQADAFLIIGRENSIGETYGQMANYVLNLWEHPKKYAEASEKMRRRALRIENIQQAGWKDFIDTIKVKQR